MALTEFAKSELTRAGLFGKDSDYEGMLGDAVMKMVEVFADEGHSGSSASMAIALFSKVARFEPLTPLTGEDDEWTEVGEGMWQNKRCPSVFKDAAGGPAYNSDGRVFRDPDGSCWINGDSRVTITFPYTPTREVVDRAAEEEASDE